MTVHHSIDLQEAEVALENVSYKLVWHDRLVSMFSMGINSRLTEIRDILCRGRLQLPSVSPAKEQEFGS
jgi:hypothetical protein